MNAFNSASIKELIEFKNKPCISIFMPGTSKGQQTIEAPIRLKNLVSQAWDRLVDNFPDSQKSLSNAFEQADVLIDNKLFWLHQKRGFALFMAPELFRYYRVCTNLRDRCTVANHFTVKPLLSLFTNKNRYYLFAISQKNVRLLEISDDQVNEVELGHVMQSIEELSQYEVREKQLQLYTLPVGGGLGRGGVSHGHATDIDKKEFKKKISEFVNSVVAGLEQFLQTDRTPIILCAEPFMQRLIRDCHPSFNVINESVSVNPTRMQNEQLVERTSPIMKQRAEKQTRTTIDRLSALMDTGWTIQNVEQIIPRAEEGRVDTLFVDPDESVWGFWNREGGLIQVHEQPADSDQDLSDIAVLQTLQHGGQVFSVPAGSIKGGAAMAAILRY